jgi:pyridoxal phosphate enzyme (YggS family)
VTALDPDRIAARYATIRRELDEMGAVGVRVVAVTKSFPVEAVRAARAAGCPIIGENYAQELTAKLAGIPAADRPEVHFIGQLQSNKVRLLAPFVDVWQTVDRSSLVTEIGRRCPDARIMIQVDFTGEPGKGGCRPDDAGRLAGEARAAGLRVIGVMTVGPTDGDPEVTRDVFRSAAALARRLGVPDVSMGMSGDWRIAIEEGATLVRLGSAIFGDRPPATA